MTRYHLFYAAKVAVAERREPRLPDFVTGSTALRNSDTFRAHQALLSFTLRLPALP